MKTLKIKLTDPLHCDVSECSRRMIQSRVGSCVEPSISDDHVQEFEDSQKHWNRRRIREERVEGF